MKACGIDRRGFLRGAAATALLGAFGGRRLFAVPPGWKPSGARRLVFGIISDTHYMLSMDFSNGYRLADGTTDAWALNALKYFRSRNVDAVMHCGDISNWGLQEEMQLFANSWFSVFPDNKAPDGHEVVKLFVVGNHDIEGYTYNTSDRIVKMFGSNYQSHLLVNGLNGLVINGTKWKNIWGEDYVNTWHKTVKGYHFFGYNTYGNISGSDVKRSESEQEFIDLVTAAGAAGELDGTKPFFMVAHKRPSTAVNVPLASYTNGIGFWGHYHQSCALWTGDEIIWWSNGTFPQIQCPALHWDGGANLFGNLPFAKAEGNAIDGVSREENKAWQGFLVEVYDDAVVIERHDFSVGYGNAKIGPDWVMPIGTERYTKANHPFSQTELAATDRELGAPQFRRSAVMGFDLGDDKLRVSIPKADGNANTRTFIYNIEFAADGQESLWKSVYAMGCNHGIGYEQNGGVTDLEVSREDLPDAKMLTVRVYPVSPLGLEGEPSTATLLMDKVRVAIDKKIPYVGYGRYELTKGANIANADNLEFVLPDWVERAAVEDGEIVIYTMPKPFRIHVR